MGSKGWGLATYSSGNLARILGMTSSPADRDRSEDPFAEIGDPVLAVADKRRGLVAVAGAHEYDEAKTVGVFHVTDRTCRWLLHSRHPVNAMAFHPTLPLLAVGSGEYDGGYYFVGELLLLHLETGTALSLISWNPARGPMTPRPPGHRTHPGRVTARRAPGATPGPGAKGCTRTRRRAPALLHRAQLLPVDFGVFGGQRSDGVGGVERRRRPRGRRSGTGAKPPCRRGGRNGGRVPLPAARSTSASAERTPVRE